MPPLAKHLSTSISPKLLAAWEIGSVVVSALIAEWFVLSFFGKSRWVVIVPLGLALGLMLVSHRVYGENATDLGFRFDNFLPSLRLVAIPTIVFVIAILIVGLIGGNITIKAPKAKLLFLPFWALFQQYALQAYINRRAQVIFGQSVTSILLVALVFALLHLPNPVLTGLTFAGGALWAFVYQRQPNLFGLAISHVIASLAISILLPATMLNSLRVGFKYLG
ncbi:MAG TPA: CPBP family glutamic-type intramembrane protease [Pyrinomonadaceae bacterium]